jgi:cyclic beta-1,2-glucan synthetase
VETPVSCFIDPTGHDLIRRDLHGPDHLVALARELAEASELAPAGRRGQPLLRHVLHTGQELRRAHEQILEASRREEQAGPETEWLLDNFHIVEEALREVRHDLPPGYYTKLPKLARGPLAGFPRVYALALSLIAHTDSSLDEEHVLRFVQAYQEVRPLTIGELWAVPIMLRLGLLENLRRLARHMLEAWHDRQHAARFLDGVQVHLDQHRAAHPDTAEEHAWQSVVLSPRLFLSDPFLVHLTQTLRDYPVLGKAGMDWLEERLARQGSDTDQVFRRESQRQAASQVCIGNCVTSLRVLSALDWNVFFEKVSVVDGILRDDPAGVYARQDFPTRDRYRQVVEKLARGSHVQEQEIARKAVELARQAGSVRDGSDHTGLLSPDAALRAPHFQTVAPETHVGCYLLGRGKAELARAVSYRPRLKDRLLDGARAHPKLVYFGGIFFFVILFLAGLLLLAAHWGAGVGMLVLVGLVALLPASELAIALMNYLVTVNLPPTVLPKLDFKDGIPEDFPTCVVMPTMLTRPDSAAQLVERLEVHYLANPDPRLCFALLTDFADAPAEHMPADDGYLRDALEGIARLNREYCGDGPDRFFLFHRRRLWNPSEKCWMGWERKRGKLQEFNRLLLGEASTSIAVKSGELPWPIRFVITLDMDTQLPREAAGRLVGALAHPLNQPRFDPASGRVVEGFGILQPRVNINMPAASRTLFTRLYAASAGIDPYTTAVSDVYQDLFGTGSFTGKGIYDVAAFEAAVGWRFPENTILSHDLIEGNFVRCGLVSDIQVLDEFPARYHAFARRDHRWARGDWQILPWLFGRAPVATGGSPVAGAGGDSRAGRPYVATGGSPVAGRATGKPPVASKGNPLPFLERWKIFDNLRRSLVAPALILFFLLGWAVLPGPAWAWTLLGLVVPTGPLLLQVIDRLRSVLRGRPLLTTVREWQGELPATLGQMLLGIVFLVDSARIMVDAALRTLHRLLISRRRLLEWETAASTDLRLGDSLTHFYRYMLPTLLLTAAIGVLVAVVRPPALFAAGPLLVAWLAAPLVAYWVSQPRRPRVQEMTPEDRALLRLTARRTWGFFETFVGDKDHWLPPDNYQEDPEGKVAHRTSPTNMGLLLLSTLAARDFGYLSFRKLLERLEKTFATLEKLERHHGHFHNWYDTLTLRSLQPVYLSTVDSGNLLACLLTLKQGLLEVREQPVVGRWVCEGLADPLRLATQALDRLISARGAEVVSDLRVVQSDLIGLEAQVRQEPATLIEWDKWLGRLDGQAAELLGRVRGLASVLRETPRALLRWAQAFADQVHEHRGQLSEVASWLEQLAQLTPETLAQTSEVSKPSEVWQQLVSPTGLAELGRQRETLLRALDKGGLEGVDAAARKAIAAAVERSGAAGLLARCERLIERASRLAVAMDFSVLYNEQRHLFAIGYNLTLGRLDNAHYDLLASEAALTSFLAVARGQAPRRHWFQLGRPLTQVAGQVALLSWGGTMFEYLMPQLLLDVLPETLLEESARAAVARQIEYGRQRHVPWGVSESGYSTLDTGLDYQYQSFGVPGLGLRRGLGQELVIAPYATLLALLVDPHAAAENLRRLAEERGEGPYGFYEAIDFTTNRLPPTQRSVVVRSYMAHHQGMGMMALANRLLGMPMRRRFHAEPVVRATELLLQERMPKTAPVLELLGGEAPTPATPREMVLPMSRCLRTPHTPHPRTHLLSNGQYTVMLTNAGGNWSYCRGLGGPAVPQAAFDVTRWREDSTRDDWGQFCYLRDLQTSRLWSAGYQPLGAREGQASRERERPEAEPDFYEVVFSTDKAEFHRLDGKIETHQEVTVSPEHNAEVRRLTLTNHDTRPHDIELTSYAEPVLAPHPADCAHPAFGKLFLETEFVPKPAALLCRRRPRSAEDRPIWAVHTLVVDGTPLGEVQFETDRARFLGRGRTPANPAALEDSRIEEGATGAVLDPIFSLRRCVRVPAGMSVSVAFTMAVADSREEALALADTYHDVHAINRAFELAWAHSQVELQHLHLSTEDAHLFQRVASHLIYSGPFLRARPEVLAANRQGQLGLWRHGISGDRAIVLVRVKEAEELLLVRQLLLAHTYWRLKGLEVDLVILNERATGYLEELQQQLLSLVRTSSAHALIDKPGGVFVRKADQLSHEDQVLLEASARVVLSGAAGLLAAQVDERERAFLVTEKKSQAPNPRSQTAPSLVSDLGFGTSDFSKDLLFFNGHGGFTRDGREYVIAAGSPGSTAGPTPAPWINVVANPVCGFLASERGGGYTWAGNSQMNRLTPWSNDPVSDPRGEVVYLRDETTGEVWTVPGTEAVATGGSPVAKPATGREGEAPAEPGPVATAGPVECRHGPGYTVYRQGTGGLDTELTLFVLLEEPVKLVWLKVRNPGGQARRLSATFYAEWVLGTLRDQAAMNVVCEIDPETGALLARNSFNADFAGRIAFADVNLRPRTLTADRTEFLGRNGDVAAPAALQMSEVRGPKSEVQALSSDSGLGTSDSGLSGRVEAGLDPCAALQVVLDLAAGQEGEVLFLLGQATDIGEARRLVRTYREPGRAGQALQEVRAWWDRLLGVVQVRTPNPALDLLLNRWLLYQTLACRVWGRSAFYQSGGAYGFRDQLQDVMALVYAAPEETRRQIVRAAGRQFVEGDVQHWWHLPSGKGIRTRFSDDFLWLPLVTWHYVTLTGDHALLEERVPFLQGPPLAPGQDEAFFQPQVSGEAGTIYEHCVRAVEHGLRFGSHGLPLMGCGDWNDGMNKVGAGGKGETVWGAWFLLTILNQFADLATRRGDEERARRYRQEAGRLHSATEENAWDGHWYRRAYFDDGTPLGSAQNDECQIDSLPQTWAVLSGRANLQRVREAMGWVERRLVKERERLILLFTPPFDKGALQPGYIRGYVPGIRENGGQYTHAATWVVWATALLGEGGRAVELFDLLNPIRHAESPEEVRLYRVEPYVVAADVYGEPPHVGRGGWTWYTGSSSWLYRVGLEALLGFRVEGDRLVLTPCVAPQWRNYEITYRHRTATYHLCFENPAGAQRGVRRLEVDGVAQDGAAVHLIDDGKLHEVHVVLG